MNNCQSPQQAACGNMLLEVFESKEVLRFYFSDVGENGLSAYEVALQEGFIGTIDEWLESLVGPPVPVAQELGDDPNLAVSQKLLKDSIDEMESSNESAAQEAERLNSLSQEAAESAEQSAISAESSKQAAELSASQAASSESGAAQSAQDSAQSAVAASERAAQSAQSAADSSDSATQAKNSSDDSAASAQAASESAQAASLSEQNASESEQESKLSAQAAADSESNAKISEQNAALSAQQSADSAAESEQQATLAGASELAAKGYSEQAKIDADRSESAAERAEEAATLVEDKLDKSAVKDELGDSKEFVINQRKITELYNLVMGWLDIPDSPAYADFTKDRYSTNGKIVRFEDLFEFERLSEATTFSEDGLRIWDVDEPRIVRGKGLLIEPESTNLVTRRVNDDGFAGNDGTSTSEILEAPPWLPVPNIRRSKTNRNIRDTFYRYRSGLESIPELHSDSFLLFDFEDLSVVGGSTSSSSSNYFLFNISDEEISNENSNANVEFFRVGTGYLFQNTKTTNNGTQILSVTGITESENSAFSMALAQREVGVPTTPILSGTSPTTRLADLLSLPIPTGHTISGDWDDTLTIEVVDGKLVHSGIGYIRELKLEKVND